MPGSDMGKDSAWNNPEQIKRRLYERVQELLQEQLEQPVELVIEKDKNRSGSIYSSMYSEAWTADVYLVDLTGANANVYLELGVRWAMSDGVTVLLAQDPSKLPFNVVAARAQHYSNDLDFLENSIGRIVGAIVEGLEAKARGETDSPVREGGRIQTITTLRLEELESELEQLRTEKGDDYIKMAATAETLAAKIDLLRRAVKVNPFVAESRYQLGITLRTTGKDDPAAIEQLRKALEYSPEVAHYWRELGIALSKSGDPRQALHAYERSIALDPSDFDATSALGGAKRRIALARAPGHVDWDLLRAAQTEYAKASKLKPRDSYPLLNIARIDLLLSQVDTQHMDAAMARFRKALPLCQFEMQDALEAVAIDTTNLDNAVEAAYKCFDYADCLLFSGQLDTYLDAYRAAVEHTRSDIRSDILRSVRSGFSSMTDLVNFDASLGDAIATVGTLINESLGEPADSPEG
jgi:tetratricopeptide (TPR) repeat protein